MFVSIFIGNGKAQSFVDKELPFDQTVRLGRLPNGMTYYIKHHEEPKDRADFFIVHNVGAVQEEDNQNGLAHFLEHMAFNGSTHFPDNGMLDYTASIGVRFGYNVNAYTSKDRTVYNVSNVPLVRESIVDSLLLIIHDWSGFLVLAPDKIEKERGVIREEWRRFFDSRSRMANKQEQIEFRGSKFAIRDVIGDPEIIRTFERQTLVDFYRKWYRPDLQAVIVVGDVDVDQIEAKIKLIFSDIPKPVNPAPKEEHTLPDNVDPLIATVSDPETKAFAVKIIFRHPYPTQEEQQNESSIRNELRRDLYLQMIRDRFSAVEKSDTASWRMAIPVSGALNVLRRNLMFTITPQKDTNLLRTLGGVQMEIERIRRYGFTQSDFNKAKTKVTTDKERSLEPLRQITNTQLVGRYINHFTRNVPYMTSEDQISITKRLLLELNYDDLSDMASEMLPYENNTIIYYLSDNQAYRIPSDESVIDIHYAVKQADILPLIVEDRKEIVFLPDSDKLIPGKATQVKPVTEFGAVEWILSNGLKVFWKPLESVNSYPEVSLQAFNRGGYNRTTDYAGLSLLSAYIRSGQSIGNIDKDDLSNALAPLRISLVSGISREESFVTGSSFAKDFESLLQLIHRTMTDPNFGDAYYKKTMDKIREGLEKPQSDSEIYADSSNRVKYGGHPWLVKAKTADLDQMSKERLLALYQLHFGNPADFTFYIAGTLATDQAKALVEKYLGSLLGHKPVAVPQNTFEMPVGQRTFSYRGTQALAPKASITRIYYGDYVQSAKNFATLRYLSYILSERYLKDVREKHGGTYSISAQQSVREFPYQKCYLTIDFSTHPDLAGILLQEVQNGIETLARYGPSPQEVNEAKLYFQKQNLERRERDNKTPFIWIGRLRTLDLIGIDLQTDDPDVFTAVTPQDVQALCRSIFDQENSFTTLYVQE
ncbi:MAG: insulinase family protein [Prevotellaceae bacterium]|nr:insulinase family protein [Prevotellaceae bacterium]